MFICACCIKSIRPNLSDGKAFHLHCLSMLSTPCCTSSSPVVRTGKELSMMRQICEAFRTCSRRIISPYLCFSTRTQRRLGHVISFRASLESKVEFIWSSFLIPRPPLSLSENAFSHEHQCYLLTFPASPQKNQRVSFSMSAMRPAGRREVCITYEGIDNITLRMRVYRAS